MIREISSRSKLILIAILLFYAIPKEASAQQIFGFTLFAEVTPFAEWTFLTGDFAGDGKLDVVGYHPSDGSVWVGTNRGSTFDFTLFAEVTPFAEWTFLTGDFAGDGKLDVVGYHPSDGSVWVGTNRAEAPPVTHQLQVSRFTTSALTDAEADTLLLDGTNVLQTNDGPGIPPWTDTEDVACNVGLSRNGVVTVFNAGDGSIDSQADFNEVIGLPGYVKVVNQINWCGGLIPNVIGCAPVPGNSMVVVRFAPALEGILWLHEYGHTKGLGHRNDDPNAVMNGTIGATRRMVNATECQAFRN